MTDNPVSVGGFGVQPAGFEERVNSKESSEASSKVDFQEVLRSSIRNVDQLQTDAESAIQKMAVGENDSVAEVMTAVEKADLAFRTLMQVRNKLVDAYEELLRMRF